MVRKLTSAIMRCMVGNRSAKGIKVSKQTKYYKELKRAQWKSLDENIMNQKQRLYEVIKFSLREVPYYRDLGLKIEEFSVETIFEDIKKFPILTKEIIRKEGTRLCPEHPLKNWTYNDTSGGTTGEPVRFCHSGIFFDYDQAGKLLFDEWAGRKLGDSQIRLWGSERDIISGKKDWMNKIYRWCRNEMFLNAFYMSDEIMDDYVKQINHKQPKMIMAYVQSIRELAQYIEKKGIKVYAPSGIMTSAGNLDNDTYELLKRVFHCPILNRYGSREMGDMACSCEKNEGLHINVRTSYIEVLDEENNTCADEEIGDIIVTSLTEYSMPLIRYKIGDRGALTSHKCSCGRGWPLLKSINGRTVDVFKTASGKKIDGEFFTHMFYEEKNVKQFQVVQDQLTHITVKLVVYDKEKVTDEFYKGLENNFRKVMGNETEFSYEFLDYIPVGKSGKRAYTISLLD